MRLPAVLLLAAVAWCQPLPVAPRPESVGISGQRLDRLRALTKADVDAKRIPGAVLLVARTGKIALHEAIGFQVRSKAVPMRKDSIFAIASMSKPITSVATMIREA